MKIESYVEELQNKVTEILFSYPYLKKVFI